MRRKHQVLAGLIMAGLLAGTVTASVQAASAGSGPHEWYMISLFDHDLTWKNSEFPEGAVLGPNSQDMGGGVKSEIYEGNDPAVRIFSEKAIDLTDYRAIPYWRADPGKYSLSVAGSRDGVTGYVMDAPLEIHVMTMDRKPEGGSDFSFTGIRLYAEAEKKSEHPDVRLTLKKSLAVSVDGYPADNPGQNNPTQENLYNTAVAGMDIQAEAGAVASLIAEEKVDVRACYNQPQRNAFGFRMMAGASGGNSGVEALELHKDSTFNGTVKGEGTACGGLIVSNGGRVALSGAADAKVTFAAESGSASTGLHIISDAADDGIPGNVSLSVKGETEVLSAGRKVAEGIRSETYNGATTRLEFDKVTVTLDGKDDGKEGPVFMGVSSGSHSRLDIHKGLTVKTKGTDLKGGTAVMAKIGDGKGGTNEIYLDGETTITGDNTKALNARGKGSKIVVNGAGGARQIIHGNGVGFLGGEVDVNLDTADSLARMSVSNMRGATTQGVYNMAVKNGATWQLIGKHSSSLDRLEMGNGSVVDLTELVNTRPKDFWDGTSLRITELAGDGGIFKLTTDISKGHAQEIRIFGKSAGNHFIDIADQSGASGVDPYEPLAIVTAEDGEANAANFTATFKALHPVELGPYVYRIGNAKMVKASPQVKGFDGTDPTTWYLYAANDEYQEPELTPSAEAGQMVGSNGYLQGMTEQQSLRQRLGDIHHFGLMDEGYTPWAKLVRSEYKIGDRDMPDADTRITGTQFGVDRALTGDTYLGFYGSYMRNKSTTSLSTVKGDYYGAGVYMAKDLGADYLDLVARFGHNKNDIESATLDGGRAKADGIGQNQFGLSIETGRRFQWKDGGFHMAASRQRGDGFYLEPQVQLSWTRHGSADFTTDKGMKGDLESYNSLLGSTGILMEYLQEQDNDAALSLYGKVMYNREFSAKPAVIYNGTNKVESDYTGGYLSYGIGVDYSTSRYEFYTELERSSKKAFQEKYRVDAGLRFRF